MNLKAAKALGLTFPFSLLARAMHGPERPPTPPGFVQIRRRKMNLAPLPRGFSFTFFGKESPARAGLSLPKGMGLSRHRHPTCPNLHTRVS